MWKFVHDEPKYWPNYLYIDSFIIIDYVLNICQANEKLIIFLQIIAFLIVEVPDIWEENS